MEYPCPPGKARGLQNCDNHKKKANFQAVTSLDTNKQWFWTSETCVLLVDGRGTSKSKGVSSFSMSGMRHKIARAKEAVYVLKCWGEES